MLKNLFDLNDIKKNLKDHMKKKGKNLDKLSKQYMYTANINT